MDHRTGSAKCATVIVASSVKLTMTTWVSGKAFPGRPNTRSTTMF